MKKVGKYYRNPAPFALTAANPAKKRRKRNAARRKRKVAVAIKSSRMIALRRLRNTAKRSKRRRAKRNPLEIQHVIVPVKNPVRSAAFDVYLGTKFIDTVFFPANTDAAEVRQSLINRDGYDSRITVRKRNRRRNPSSNSPMSKHRKRRHKGSRKNPARNTPRRRSHSRRRNKARRNTGSRMFRNPPIISEVIDKQNIKRGVGALAGIVGTRWTINRLIQGDPTTGQRMFDLPGVTYSSATAPLTQAQFSEKNKIALAFYEALIPAVAGYLVRKYDNAISEGLYIATVTNIGIAAVRTTQMGQYAGLNAFLPRGGGMNTFIPGVPPMLSGPGTQFINNGSPVASRRNGMSAAVNPRWAAATTTGGPDPFRPN